jgi:hypothetical protein
MTETGSRTFYHGTKADLKPGDMLQGGYSSNYTERRSPWIYFSETVFAATWGAELAKGEGPGRIYVVEPTEPFMDDPNVTDRKFPGNPTKSYRSKDPLLELFTIRPLVFGSRPIVFRHGIGICTKNHRIDGINKFHRTRFEVFVG